MKHNENKGSQKLNVKWTKWWKIGMNTKVNAVEVCKLFGRVQ